MVCILYKNRLLRASSYRRQRIPFIATDDTPAAAAAPDAAAAAHADAANAASAAQATDAAPFSTLVASDFCSSDCIASAVAALHSVHTLLLPRLLPSR